MIIRRGTETFPTKSYAFPDPDKIATQHFLVNKGEYDGKLNHVVRATLNPGFDLPFHTHTDDEEIFVILFGNAEYTDNDRNKHILHAGDIMICRSGEGHAIGNPFGEPTILMEINLPVDK
ncbi:MAG: cupin domain-containing protein [Ruminococcaceae bacterium]|nr:cupin domain-containing protein [Oscillospiraceae bacterium]